MKRQRKLFAILLLAELLILQTAGQHPSALVKSATEPPRVTAARRFLQAHGLPAHRSGRVAQATANAAHATERAYPLRAHPLNTPNNAPWQSIGPVSVTSVSYGSISGRVTSLALDPSDVTGNSLYVGTTGGGVWHSTNAASSVPANITFTPLTDGLSALSGAVDASISIGALTVQQGATGVILAGTGDPNDALDSYYGAGILRSTNGGTTWSLIYKSSDFEDSLAQQDFYFVGEGIAGFAWSTVNPQLVVVAVSQAYGGALVNSLAQSSSYEGLYYSQDAGATWHLATINDSAGNTVQGPVTAFVTPDGNAATAVVWNPIRQLFIAAVRFHGYYQSSDGIVWTRMVAQPGTGLTTGACPTNLGQTGSQYCPLWRGSLAVNPSTGDTFAWTVDESLQDQGIWQDACAISGGTCSNQTLTFANQLNTAQLESNTLAGPVTIPNGDYDLTLAAVPSQQDTLIFAGANDLWKCSLALGCMWRNTTNASSCMSAQVAPYQHALTWNVANPLEVFVGNDSGLWQSLDAIGETGAACSPSDGTHFENLNSSLGSLAEVTSLSQSSTTANTILAGLGVNGTTGVKGTSTPPSVWPEILGGEGGPVEISPSNSTQWYVNNQAGVSIFLCAQGSACTPSSFGQTAVVTDADVGGDGDTMATPAPFQIDALDNTQLLVATCRVWRGAANGSGWSNSNAISPILDLTANTNCQGDALIRSITSLSIVGSSSEVIYVGMYGTYDGGGSIAGHIFSAVYNSLSGTTSPWQDLTFNPVQNSSAPFNYSGADISSIVIDSHDATGNTLYVTLETFPTGLATQQQIYRSTDGGTHWSNLESNLPSAPANALAIDPGSANTVYVALDTGVYYTSNVGACATGASSCWSVYGVGLPTAPIMELNVTPLGASTQVLTAGTYGRGIWQIPLLSAGAPLTSATVSPTSLIFANQAVNSSSSAQTVTLKNTGSVALTPTLISMSGSFTETDNCVNQTVSAGKTCTIKVFFVPIQSGSQSGQMIVSANISGGQLSVSMSGTAVTVGTISTSPPSLIFAGQPISTTSQPQAITLNNSGGTAVPIQSMIVTSPFKLASNSCGSSLAASSSCAITITFAPTVAGAASGALTITDTAGSQTVPLSGTGMSVATDTLSVTKLIFPGTTIYTASVPLTFTLTNSGDATLNSISTSLNGDYQVSNNCGTSLAGHSSCTFSITFTPTVLGTENSSVLVIDALRTQNILIYGVGVTAPVINSTRSTMSFYSAVANATATQTLNTTISNTGGASMATPQLQISGQAAASFNVIFTNCTAPLAGNGGQCVATFGFHPVFVGPNIATLTISTSTPGVAPVQIPLSGIGLAPPAIFASPTSIAFSNTALGSTISSTVIVRNIGGVAFSDLQWAISNNPTNFSISKTTCTPSLGVHSSGANVSCTILVTYTALSTQVTTGTLTLSSASGVCVPVTVSLNGYGAPPSVIASSSTELDFGTQILNQASTIQTITISDNGSVPLTGLSIASGSAVFTLQQSTCGTTLVASHTCTVQVLFNPAVAGYQTGTLTINTTTQYVANATVLLTGTGVVPATIQALPAQLNFGSVLINSSSIASTLTVTNTGSLSLTGLSLQASPSYSLTQNNCLAALAPNASCTTGIVFTPTLQGAITGNINISSNAVGAISVSVPLSGYGYPGGYLGVSPGNINFGVEYLNQSTASQAVTISNTGTHTLGGLAFSVAGNFAITSQTCGISLAKNSNCLVNLNFTPTTMGGLVGQLKVTSTTAGASAVYIALAGTGQSDAVLAVSTAQLSFASTPVATSSQALNVTLTNTGISTVSGVSIAMAGPFTNSTCPSSLMAGATCTISLTFNPNQQGPLTGVMTISSTTAGVVPVTVGLSGTATAPASLSVNLSTLSFPDTPVSGTSTLQSITVSNPGTGPLNTPTLTLFGEPTDFQIVGNTCSQVLVAGGSCTVTMLFSPTVAGGRAGALNISSTSLGVATASVQLNGTGLLQGSLSVSSSALSFATLSTGQLSLAQTVTVSAAGVVNISAISVTIDPGFQVSQNTCTGGILSGGSCTLQIEFAPTAPGAYNGQLTIVGVGALYPVSVSLTGTGSTVPSLQTSPSQLGFQTTGVNQTSAPATVLITNAGTDSAVTNLQWTISPVGASFQVTSTTCSSTLAAASSCTVSVSFMPTTTGPAAGWLVVSGSNVPSSVTIPLQGVGLTFALNVRGTSSYTVASGQVADFLLAVTIPSTTPASSTIVQGVFTLQCGVLPPNTTCTFNPPCIPSIASTGCINATSNAPGEIGLVIQTGQQTASNHLPESPSHIWSRSGLFMCGLVLLPLGLYRSRRWLLLIALLAVVTSGVTSCTNAKVLGSGSGGPGTQHTGGSGLTAPGTYTIPIFATADGVQQQTSILLTVD